MSPAPTVDANNAHHGAAGTSDGGRYVTKPLTENAAGLLSRSRSGAATLQKDSLAALTAILREQHPQAVSAHVKFGELRNVTLQDGSVQDVERTPDLDYVTHLSVLGNTDSATDLTLSPLVEPSGHRHRVTAQIYFQTQGERGGLTPAGSASVDITDVLLSALRTEGDEIEPDELVDDLDLHDELFDQAKAAGLIDPPEGCSYDVAFDHDDLADFLEERGGWASAPLPFDAAVDLIDRTFDGDQPLIGWDAAKIVAATSSRLGRSDPDNQERVLRELIASVDTKPFGAARSSDAYSAGFIVHVLSSGVSTVAHIRGERGTPIGDLEFKMRAKELLPELSDQEHTQLRVEFEEKTVADRLPRITRHAAHAELVRSVEARTNPIPAPPQYPFLSVPATKTDRRIDLLLVQHSNTESIVAELTSAEGSFGAADTDFLREAIHSRRSQLRP